MPLHQINVKNSSDIESWEWGGGCGREAVRAGSGSSRTSCSNSSGDICRICHCESETHNPLLAPCYCSGSLKYVHQSCLQQWLTASETRSCELCKFNFIMHTKIKPFNEWRLLEMSGVERRRLCCAVLFHCVAALCVMWSLFVLIERAVEEVNRGLIAWPFWTKLVVVAVGFTGGAVFMYIQCRQYLHLCNRWRAHNRILLIQNAPEKIPMSAGSPLRGRRERSARGQVVANIEPAPAPAPAAYHEEDESGGFETYRGNPHRRLSVVADDCLRADRDDTRRYSDTKLMQPNTAVTTVEEPNALQSEGVYHISVDPLEADIRSLLELEARRAARSLPNLRASRESLLPATSPAAASAPVPAPAPAPRS
ncbi:E3 ubiquitin-protein ligase MARCHF4-like [Plodia interpunctella]|uniref:E3 ubiquitin-protein ligase MARCHF4-like n=1 Tax=Plodia interpunctella TaxID=58824 RepID=UPI0023686DF4|nr:E3 ubiquitin-protein ligase MARCHF4-like [Plodia interpunctella]